MESPVSHPAAPSLVIFSASNMVSDLFDCALANGLLPAKVVIHLPEPAGERDIPLATRIADLKGLCDPKPTNLRWPWEHDARRLGR